MVDLDSLQAKVAALTKDYSDKLPNDLDIFLSYETRTQTETGLEIISEIRNHAHKISGSAGSYGFMALSDVATKLDVAGKEAMDNEDFSDDTFHTFKMLLSDLIAELKSTIEKG